MTSYYSQNELKKLGFNFVGKDVFISRKASFYNPEKINIGNHVRIDDFCILSGSISLGNYVHISAFTALYGKAGIKIGNFCGVSPRCTLLSESDDFSGNAMISPMVPHNLTNLTSGPIILKDFVQIGANSIIMPNCVLEEGAVCGCFSFINKKISAWSINVGIPCRFLKKRLKHPKRLSHQIKEI